MKRSNAAVKIPPAPPKTTSTTYKPVQIGTPAPSGASPPSKPRRGVPKSLQKEQSSTFFYNNDTLSDVQVNFSKSEESQHTLGNQTEAFYENIPRGQTTTERSIEQHDTSESSVRSRARSIEDCLTRDTCCDNKTSDQDPISHGVGSNVSTGNFRNIGTFDNLAIGPISSPNPIYENVHGRKATYLVPDELLEQTESELNPGHNSLSPPADPSSAGGRSKSTPTSPMISLRSPGRAPHPPPFTGHQETIYKDPASLFECSSSTQLQRLSVGGVPDIRSNRSRSTGNLSSIPSSRATTIEDSGSDVTIQDSGSDRTSSFEDFVVLRRNQKEARAARKPRALSEIITTDVFRSRAGEAGWFGLLKQSVFGGGPVANRPPAPPKSTFYVDNNEQDDALYHSIETIESTTVTSKVRKTLPESLVTNLTPAVFEIPQPNPSVFYTDQEEHIYSTSDTLGGMDFPEISVQNKGYRDPKVSAVERQEESIFVRPGSRSPSLGSILSSETHYSIPDVTVTTDEETDHVTVTADEETDHVTVTADHDQVQIIVPETAHVKRNASLSESETCNDQVPANSEYTVVRRTEEEDDGGVVKQKLGRVSLMRKAFENIKDDSSVSNSSTRGGVVLRDKTRGVGRLSNDRKQIVSLQFSSDVLEIEHK